MQSLSKSQQTWADCTDAAQGSNYCNISVSTAIKADDLSCHHCQQGDLLAKQSSQGEHSAQARSRKSKSC